MTEYEIIALDPVIFVAPLHCQYAYMEVLELLSCFKVADQRFLKCQPELADFIVYIGAIEIVYTGISA